MDPLNAVALPDNGMLTVNQQQMLQPNMLSQQQPNFTSSSMLGYQQQSSSMLQRNFLANNSGSGSAISSRLSTVSKHSMSQNMASNLHHPANDMSLKGSISMVNPSSPPIPRTCNVSSSLFWTPSVSSGIITSSSAGDGQYRPPTGFIGDPHLQKERHPHPDSLRHPFQQHAYTIVDPQHQQNA